MVWPAVIAAGASLLGGALSQRGSTGSAKQAREFEHGWRLHQDRFARERYQIATADAKKAGLHPLFALGAGMGQSPSYSSVSYPPSGSHLGTGIARAGQAVAQGARDYKVSVLARSEEQRRQEAHEAGMRERSHQDWLNMMERDSILKRAEGNANTGARMNEDGTIVIPAPAGASINRAPLAAQTRTPTARATRVTPHATSPLWVTAESSDGVRRRVLNPELGLDELGQVVLAAEVGFETFWKLAQATGGWTMKRAQQFYRSLDRTRKRRIRYRSEGNAQR